MKEKHNKGADCCAHEHHEHHEHHHGHDGCGCGHNHEEVVDKKEFLFKIISALALFAAGYIISEFTALPYVGTACFALSYIIVGFSIVREAIEGVMHGNVFNENFLMSIASLGAFAIGEYSEGCAVVLLYTIGEYLQSKAVGKSRKSIVDMLEGKKSEVTVIRNGENVQLPPEDVAPGEQFIVKPGQKIELDGIIINGSSEIDMSALTGESIPVSASAGDEVLSGSVCCDGMLVIKAEKPYSESTVARILDMIEDANEKKSRTEKFISRFARVYTPIVCLIALLIILVPPLFFGGEWKEWIYRGLSALVVSCPCAIVISVPLGFFGGLGACSKQGILIKGSNYLEMLAKCNVAVFDKTGTITSGKFEYVNCECVHCHCENTAEHRELLGLIAACEKYSNHPLAKSVSLAFGQFAEKYSVTGSEDFSGMGVSAVIDGKTYFAGNEKLMAHIGVDFKETELVGTAIYLASQDEFLGDIVFADSIKEDSKDAIAMLKKAGVRHTAMLTGDKKEIAADVAAKAGIDKYYAKLLPGDKVEKLREIKQGEGGLVLYVGDGINDAPVLAEADLGIAMGDIGSDIAIEAADIVVMGGALSKIPAGRGLAKRTMRIVNENIIFSIAVKAAIIIGCATGIFDENAMWLAVFGDVGVCLIAVANSLRTMLAGIRIKKANRETDFAHLSNCKRTEKS
ncbi:MAG: cadmium-translocating P-type ATPase [Clostridiales bacterium]|nr:cadmium-translocating P-type ATPase [Clostridiales bacterium]